MHLIAFLDSVLKAMAAGGNHLPVAWHIFCQAAAPTVVTALWQGVAVASGLAICLRLAPRMSAAHRFAVWAAGFAALVLLPFLPFLSHFMAGTAHVASSKAAGAAVKPWIELSFYSSIVLAALWLAASVLRAADLAIHSLRLRKLWKTAIPVQDCNGALTPSLTAMWGRARVRLCTTQQLERPSVIGFFAPRILIPDWLYARLTPGELDQIVLHETEHLRRRDDWTNLFQKLCLVLFPLNPALWWMERRLCREREMACDEGVVRITRAPRAYAACLTSLAERGLQRRAEALSLGAWQRRPELARRVHSILRRGTSLSPLTANALLGVVGCGLLFGSVELARCPQVVAFVPAQTIDSSLAPASTTPRTETASLIRRAYAPARRSATVHAALRRRAATNSPRLAETQATEVADTYAPVPRSAEAPAIAAEARSASPKVGSASPHQVMTKAVMPAAPSNPAQEPQWIVFTAWEQVETTSPSAAQAASNSPAPGSDLHPAVNQSKDGPPAQLASRVTVTRLILKVYPVNSASKPSSLATLRDGWLVIQL